MEQWRAELRRARYVYVIGLRVNEADGHIWKPLRSTKAVLAYVGRDHANFTEWSKTRRKRSYVLAESFAEAMPLLEQKLMRR
jgi:hypothetical protein